MRDYGTEPLVWDGDPKCEHEWKETVGKFKKPTHGESSPDMEYNSLKGDSKNKKYTTGSFCIKCGAWKGELGLEPHFDLYIKHLCNIFDEVKRVLKNTGTLWVNIGDTYFGSGKGVGATTTKNKQVWTWTQKEKRICQNCGKEFLGWKFQIFCCGACAGVDNTPRSQKGKLPNKTLTLVPFRFAIEMVNRGWILRNTIIWHKRNALPQSARDRFTTDFEYLFFFTKKPKYFFNQQFEPYADDTEVWYRQELSEGKQYTTKKPYKENFPYASAMAQNPSDTKRRILESMKTSLGRNKRTVWSINPKPFSEAHFAVFPEELVETPIKAGSPKYVCKKCGKPREKIVDSSERVNTRAGKNVGTGKSGNVGDPNLDLHKADLSKYRQQIKYKEIGYTDCGCGVGFEGGVVLDPFMGSGTTGLVAQKLGRQFVGLELNPEYVKMAERRLSLDSHQLKDFGK